MWFKKFIGITDVKSRFLKDQLLLLQDIIKASVVQFPFQNITLMGKPSNLPEDGEFLKMRDILESNFVGTGGLCAHTNLFLKHQLECIGYRVTHIQGSFRRTAVPNAHNLLIVHIPEHKMRKGGAFLVDVGSGLPIHEPLRLHDFPYKRKAGGFNYFYEFIDEATVLRRNVAGDAIIGEKPGDFVSPNDCTIPLSPKTYKDTKETAEASYRDKASTSLHTQAYCFRYLSVSPEDFEAVAVLGRQLIHITKNTRTVERFSDFVQTKPLIYKYFNMIHKDHVDTAIDRFTRHAERLNKEKQNT